MKKHLLIAAASSLAAALASHAEEKKEIELRRLDVDPHHAGEPDDARIERVPVTFLGVETAAVGRTLAAQLGLPPETGLVVTHVLPDSPAAAVLQEDDILTKLDDQVLVDTHQLSVLVRAHKEGDEVALTIYRGGKESKVKAKLGKHERPKRLGWQEEGPGPDNVFRYFNGEIPGGAFGQALPGLNRDEVDVLRMIGRERQNWFHGPRVHVVAREGGKGWTILDLPEGNLVLSDESGAIEVNASNGKRELTVKNPKGEVTFKGPITTEEERAKLPPEVKERLGKLEKIDVDFEPGADFKQETALPPPAKTKIRHRLPPREPAAPPPPPF